MASSPATETRRVSHRQDQVIKIEMEHIPTGERVPLMNESLPEVEVIGLHRGGDRETWKYVRFRKGNHFVRFAHTWYNIWNHAHCATHGLLQSSCNFL